MEEHRAACYQGKQQQAVMPQEAGKEIKHRFSNWQKTIASPFCAYMDIECILEKAGGNSNTEKKKEPKMYDWTLANGAVIKSHLKPIGAEGSDSEDDDEVGGAEKLERHVPIAVGYLLMAQQDVCKKAPANLSACQYRQFTGPDCNPASPEGARRGWQADQRLVPG